MKTLNDIVIPDKNFISENIKQSMREMMNDGNNLLEIGYAWITVIHDCLYDIELEEE